MRRVVRACSKMTACIAALLCLWASGCVQVHVPKPRDTDQRQVTPLSSHVDFLTQPALKGRKCRSLEAGYVRQYIRGHFDAAGMVPWGRASGFDESFGFGTNVIGVLRGADPALSDEVIIVSANYDGLGMKDDKLHPGAANNASGVATLLQLAQRLADQRQHLRRSVAFAALDCGQERYLGAFALSLRKDFDPTKVAAVIDMDLLGRRNFDTIENTLIIVGTERYPEIRQLIASTASQLASQPATRNAATRPVATQTAPAPRPLRVMLGGSDLLPPISGYFAFEQWPVPVLLLTNGLYSDFHKPGDTADKLDYDLLQRQTDLLLRVVRDLASRENTPQRVEPIAGDREELQAILTTLEEALEHGDNLQLTPVERRRLTQVAERARNLLAAPQYTLADRKAFLIELVEKGAPSIIRFFYAPPKPDPATLVNPRRLAAALSWYEFFASHRPFASYAMQQVIRHFLDARGNLLRLLSTYVFASCEIRPDEIAFVNQSPGRHRLGFLYPTLKIQAGISTRDLNVGYEVGDCRGTQDEIVDYCLLYWSAGQPDCMPKVMPAVLRTVTSADNGDEYDTWLAWRMEQVEADTPDSWRRSLWRTQNPDVLKLLLQKKPSDSKKLDAPLQALERIIRNRQMRADVRADAITALPSDPPRDVLLLLVDLLADHSLIRRSEYLPAWDPTFPFHSHVAMREARMKPIYQLHATVGRAAYERLKQQTGQDFRGNPAAWRDWILANR